MREMSWRRRQTAILTPSSSDHSSTSSPSWLGLLNRGSLRAASPQPASWFSRWHPIPNWLQLSVPWLYYCLSSTCFRCSSAYLHKCISWFWGSIYNSNSSVRTLDVVWKTCGERWMIGTNNEWEGQGNPCYQHDLNILIRQRKNVSNI